MAVIVPYRSNGSRRAMIARTLTSVGTRAHAPRVPMAPMAPMAPRTLAGLGCGAGCAGPRAAPLSYAAAKQQTLGALGSGLTTATRQVYGGVTTGAAAAGITTAIGTSIAGAIGAGAAAGSVVPIIGTAIGAIVGLLASGILNHKSDPEVANFNQAIALYKQNPTSVIDIANKYLVLAGLFDLQSSQVKGNIPIYKKYGRMGEQRFTTDMVQQIYNAAQTGQITNSDTPLTVMSKVVQPWIDSFGFGPMTDANAQMITYVLIGMIADYVTGNQRVWSAVGGQFPFANLPPFSLPQPVAPPPPVAALPPPVQTAAPAPQTDDQVLAAQGWQRVGTDSGHGIYAKKGIAGQYAWVNGSLVPSVQSSTAAGCMPGALWNGTQCVMPGPVLGPVPTVGSCTAPYVWNGTQCVLPNNAIPPSPPPASTAPPASYSPVGSDSAGNAIYANAQGVLYSWTGTGMQIFNGQLAAGNSSAAQMQAALQNALAQGQSAQQAAAAALQQAQSAGVAITPALQQQVAAQVDATQAAPIQPIAAGVGSGLGNTAAIISIAATVLGLMFATARPAASAGTGKKRRRRA